MSPPRVRVINTVRAEARRTPGVCITGGFFSDDGEGVACAGVGDADGAGALWPGSGAGAFCAVPTAAVKRTRMKIARRGIKAAIGPSCEQSRINLLPDSKPFRINSVSLWS